MNEQSRCGLALEARPRTAADRRFMVAYRTNAGLKVEERLLARISDEYLDDLLSRAVRDRLRARLENERRRRGPAARQQSLLERLLRKVR